MNNRKISSAVIRRLPRYYRYLSELIDNGTERVSSNELSKLMNVTASQVRQDLNNFGGFGQQGYGYNVSFLRDEIAKILGIDSPNQMIIIGGGNLGCAIAGYPKFESRNFVVKGIFDVDPHIVGKKVRDITVMPLSELDVFIAHNDISIAALTVPKEAAKDMAKKLYSLGIRAFWNFAHVDLELPKDAFSENVHLSDSLMQLTYMLNNKK
ncbi:MAG: redox-sensing transcriptional repressor Rex [Lachnospiraceae bacterium]|nr:redox-sensing transcriptional repressor Rex [Candidatus Minthocola equi]